MPVKNTLTGGVPRLAPSARTAITSIRMLRRLGVTLALAVMPLVASLCVVSSAQAGTDWSCGSRNQVQACTNLTLWYSAARGDYFTTSFWRYGEDHQPDGGYVYVTTAGAVARPDRPQPAGTVALWNWYSPSREDNFATTDPGWVPNGPNDSRSSGGAPYMWPGLLGYVFTTNQSYCGASGLELWWNPKLGDNAVVPTTANIADGYFYAGRLGFYDPGPC